MKKILLSLISLTIISLLMLGIAIGWASIQRRNDVSALKSFVTSQESLKVLHNKQPISENISCILATGEAGKCTAILYPVTAKECESIEKILVEPKNDCRAVQLLEKSSRDIELQLGEIYISPNNEHHGKYATFIMNEKNLFWKYW